MKLKELKDNIRKIFKEYDANTDVEIAYREVHNAYFARCENLITVKADIDGDYYGECCFEYNSREGANICIKQGSLNCYSKVLNIIRDSDAIGKRIADLIKMSGLED